MSEKSHESDTHDDPVHVAWWAAEAPRIRKMITKMTKDKRYSEEVFSHTNEGIVDYIFSKLSEENEDYDVDMEYIRGKWRIGVISQHAPRFCCCIWAPGLYN